MANSRKEIQVLENKESDTSSKSFANDESFAVDIVHPVFKAPKEQLRMDEMSWEVINRICFRGDNRDPSLIFKIGFIPQGEVEDYDPCGTFSSQVGLAISAPFCATKELVSCTTQFSVAPFFPSRAELKESWVYIFKVTEGFNTHGHGLSALIETRKLQENASLIFAQEISVKKINPENIIAAVHLTRWPSDQVIENEYFAKLYKAYGKYKLNYFVSNKNCNLPAHERKRAIQFIKAEIAANKKAGWHYIPSPESAYQKNSMFSFNQTKRSSDAEMDKTTSIEIKRSQA